MLLGQQSTVFIKGFRVGGRGGAAPGEFQAQGSAAGDAERFADQPIRLGRNRDFARRQLRGWRDFGQQDDFSVVAVVDDVARTDDLLRHRPLDRPGLETFGKLPGDLGRQSGVAAVLPVSVPVRGHLEPQAHGERLAGGDGSGVGKQVRFDQFRAFVCLGIGDNHVENDHQQREQAGGEKAGFPGGEHGTGER